MRKVVILIGFEYHKISNWSRLPGIPVDLYLAYMSALKMDPDILIVITDIVKDNNKKILKQAILDGIVDENILDFIEVIQERDIYHVYSNRYLFLSKLEELCTGADQLFIYYTGHAKSGKFILPDGLSIDMLRFRDLILNNTDTQAEIFLLLDCCQCIGFELPYRLNKNMFRLSYNPNKFWCSQRIICLTSAMRNEDSAATHKGSYFTHTFFRNFQLRSLPKILALEIRTRASSKKYTQTANIYSSYPDKLFIPFWFYRRTQFIITHNSGIITIEKCPQRQITFVANNNFLYVTKVPEDYEQKITFAYI